MTTKNRNSYVICNYDVKEILGRYHNLDIDDDDLDPEPGDMRKGIAHIFACLPNHKVWLVEDFISSKETRNILAIHDILKGFKTDQGRLLYISIFIDVSKLSYVGHGILRTYLVEDFANLDVITLDDYYFFFKERLIDARIGVE